jgi:hypothetical protein
VRTTQECNGRRFREPRDGEAIAVALVERAHDLPAAEAKTSRRRRDREDESTCSSIRATD